MHRFSSKETARMHRVMKVKKQGDEAMDVGRSDGRTVGRWDGGTVGRSDRR